MEKILIVMKILNHSLGYKYFNTYRFFASFGYPFSMEDTTGPHIHNEEPKDENNRITRLMAEMKAHLCALEERINQIGVMKKTKRNVP